MYTPSDLHRRNDRLDSDRERRKRMDQPSQYNRYERHLADFREKEKLDAENQRAMALENMKQRGQLDIAKLQDAGQTSRVKISEAGMNRRSGVEQANMMKYRGDALAFDREKFDFGKTQTERSFALDRDKALFEQFAKIKGLDNVGLGVETPAANGDLMDQWNTFRTNAGGLTNETMDFAIAKKLNNAKAMGIPLEKINFTDAERSRLVGGTNDGGANSGQNMGSSLDWIEGTNGRRRYFDQNGGEVISNAPSSRSDFSGVDNQLMASHRSGVGIQQTERAQTTTGVPFIAPNQVQETIQGPQYRGSVNPLSRVNRNRPVNPNWFDETFGPFGHGVNPRYRK